MRRTQKLLFAAGLLAAGLAACSSDPAAPGDDASDTAPDSPGDDMTDVDSDVGPDLGSAGDADLDDDSGIGPDGGRERDEEALRAYCGDGFAAVEDRIDGLLGDMSIAEKVALMHGALGVPIGGAWETPPNEARGIPALRMLDGPRGVSLVAGNGTAFPVAIARGATWDPDLERRIGAAIGREVRAKGSSVVLAPMINLVTHPRWGRAQEAYGEDPHHVGALGLAFIEGAQQFVIASAKHFAANNIEDTRFDVNAVVDERTLREVYLPQFRRAVVEGRVGSVMSAYNLVNGTYCSENTHLLREILKGEWRFQGFVESDWFYAVQSTSESAIAGLDIEMPAPFYYGNRLVQAVEAGSVDPSVIDEAAGRVLRAIYCYALDSDPPVREAAVVESAEHLALALEAAQRSIVLLRNEADALPIDRGFLPSVAVIGPLADVESIGDTGSSNVAPSDVITPIEGLAAAAGEATVTHVAGWLDDEPGRATVSAADVVVAVVGLTPDDEGEGLVGAGDRESLELSVEQVDLLAAAAELNDRVVVVLIGGSAITMADWIDDVEAVVMAWYPGQMGGQAIADVLFGNVNPSGRLPLSFPVAEADLPPFDNTSLEVVYPRFHGYRHLDRQDSSPLFPFGFGLGYTRFELANLSLSEAVVSEDDVVTVAVEVSNVGDRAGIETVQLYVGAQVEDELRFDRELEGFVQVELAAGETEVVSIELPVASLAIYDVDAQAWTVEPLSYSLTVGTSAGDAPLAVTLEVASNE